MKHIAISAAAAIVCFSAAAQTFNPSVEVTNEFISSVGEFNKNQYRSAVPDSVTRFDLNFDYGVFEKPYKGAYDFTPYNIMFTPETTREKRSLLFVDLGAGYTLHPVAKAVFSPRLNGRFGMTFYQDLNGYYGPYRMIGPNMEAVKLSEWSGYDLNELAGVRSTLRLDKADLTFDLSYNGIYVTDQSITNGRYNDFKGEFRVASSEWAENFMAYDVDVLYELAGESYPSSMKESRFLIAGSLAPVSDLPCKFIIDFNTGYTGYYGTLDSAIYNIDATPRVTFNLWKFNISTGMKFSYITQMEKNTLHVYPDLKADISMFNGKLDLFAGIKGGDQLNSYSKFKKENHHFSIDYAPASQMLGFSRERINTYAGVSGSISSLLQYDIRGGYAMYDDAPLYSVASGANRAALGFADYSMGYADASVIWESQSVEVISGLHFRKTSIASYSENVFDLPMISGDLSAIYNWHKRIFGGLSLEAVSARSLYDATHVAVKTMPAYFDLGIYGEYRLGRNVSIWARGGNLLNQTVQVVPFIAERGINFTAGVCLNIR